MTDKIRILSRQPKVTPVKGTATHLGTAEQHVTAVHGVPQDVDPVHQGTARAEGAQQSAARSTARGISISHVGYKAAIQNTSQKVRQRGHHHWSFIIVLLALGWLG